MTRYRVIDGAPGILIWIALPALVAAACALGMYRAVVTGAPWGARALLLVTPLTWLFITALRWLGRMEYARSISFYTKHGVRVRLQGRAWVERWAVERATMDASLVARTWLQKVGHPWPAALDDAFDAVTITFVPAPLRDAHGRQVHGLTDGKDVYIEVQPNGNEDDWMSLVRHELAHIALDAAGAPADENEQHAIMKRLGYGL